jgi:hypothetical protein
MSPNPTPQARWKRANKQQRARWALERARLALHALGMRLFEIGTGTRNADLLALASGARRALAALDAAGLTFTPPAAKTRHPCHACRRNVLVINGKLRAHGFDSLRPLTSRCRGSGREVRG